MPFQSSLTLDSALFSQAKRRAAGGRAVRKTAREFAKNLQDKMENSPHTGKVVTKARGATFRVTHQQSRRGQRPAPFTKTLLRSIRPRRISEVESEVVVGAEYAEKLVKIGRVIVSKSDKQEAQADLDRNLSIEMNELL